MLIEDGNKAIAVCWFQEMRHFVNDDVFEEVLGLFYKLGVEPDMTSLMRSDSSGRRRA